MPNSAKFIGLPWEPFIFDVRLTVSAQFRISSEYFGLLHRILRDFNALPIHPFKLKGPIGPGPTSEIWP